MDPRGTEPNDRPRTRFAAWRERPLPAGTSPAGGGAEWRFSLEARRSAPALARDGIAALGRRLSAGRMEDARLLVSELVTNAVVHGGPRNGCPSIEVHVRVLAGSAAVCVSDGGAGFAPADLVGSRPGVPGRRGLELVAILADRFGIAGRRPFRVWFEVDF